MAYIQILSVLLQALESSVKLCSEWSAAKFSGYLYMPLCALLSALVFRRRYGWLEANSDPVGAFKQPKH